MPAAASPPRPVSLPRRRWLQAALAVPAVLAGGCAVPTAPQTAGLLGERSSGRNRRVELESVPFHPQLDHHCGPAALATALGAMGTAVEPERLAEQVFLPARSGSLQVEMLAGARRHGAVAVRLEPTLAALRDELEHGRPVVVLQNLAMSFAPRWHYAVLVGMDLDDATAVLRSGTTRREVMRLRTFEHTWRRAGHWAFVALPPGQWPVRKERERAIDAAIGFERAASPEASERVYRSALDHWPGDLTLTMGLGNSLAAAGRWAEAAATFEGAARIHDAAPAWINLSTALLKLDDAHGALAAAQAARRVAGERWAAAATAAHDAATAAATSSGWRRR